MEFNIFFWIAFGFYWSWLIF